MCIWKGTNHGTYTVKTAYYLYVNHFTDAYGLAVPGDWRIFWSLNIRQIMKYFL